MNCPTCTETGITRAMRFVGADVGGMSNECAGRIKVMNRPRSIYWCPECGTIGDSTGEHEIPDQKKTSMTLDGIAGVGEKEFREQFLRQGGI